MVPHRHNPTTTDGERWFRLSVGALVVSVIAAILIPVLSPDSASFRFDTVTAVTCGSVRHCVAVGIGVRRISETRSSVHLYALVSGDSGQHWQVGTESIPEAVGDGTVSCWDAAHCVLGGRDGRLAITTDGGWRWHEVHALAMSTTGLECPSPRRCIAVGYLDGRPAIATTSDGAATWKEQPLRSALHPLNLWCSLAGDCFISGWDSAGTSARAPLLLRMTRAAIDPLALPSNSEIVWNGECVQDRFCITVAVGGQMLRSTTNGSSWSVVPLLATMSASLRGVACVTPIRCLATTDRGFIVSSGLDRWVEKDGSALPDAIGVYCTGAGWCLVAGASSTLTLAAAIYRSDKHLGSWSRVWQGP